MNNLPIEGKSSPTLIMTQISASLESRLGGPVQVVKLSNNFMEKYFDHSLIIFGTSGEEIPKSSTVRTFRNNRYGFFTSGLTKPIRRRIQESDLILIHGFYLFSTLASIRIAKAGKIFIMPHGSLESYQDNFSKFRKFIFDICFNFLNKTRHIEFLVGSAEEVIGVKNRFSQNLVHVVGLGIDSVAEQFLHEDSVRVPLRLLCLSRITHKKRIDLCIEVVKYLRDRDLPTVLTIAGEGDETLLRDLMQIVEMNDLEEVVKFIGFIDGEDKHELYRDSDLLLLPSENENFAISIAEAIAHQVPVVVSQNVAMHSFVKTHQTGKIIDELNVENLAEAIISLKSDYYKYWKGCANSKSILDWNVVFGRWREILETRERSQER